MRNSFFTAVSVLALAGLICSAPANAEDQGMGSQSQPDASTSDTTTPATKDNHSMGKGMGMEMGMGKMKRENMKGMMHECMGMNKDRKMCDQDMMQKCQKEMSKGECDKMMKQAKAQDSATKKK